MVMYAATASPSPRALPVPIIIRQLPMAEAKVGVRKAAGQHQASRRPNRSEPQRESVTGTHHNGTSSMGFVPAPKNYVPQSICFG